MIQTKPEVRPIETVTPIKPSEAIRLGCLLAPVQGFGRLTDGREAACAIGAMYLGAFGSTQYAFTSEGIALMQLSAELPCPKSCGPRGRGCLATPAHLNDDHRWSRERIADWLESIGL